MAGIGFELKKLLHEKTFLGDFTAYLYAAMLSSGPWLMSIISLAVLGIFSGVVLSFTEHEIFRSTVIYTYAFSLIFVGLIQMVTTRYLADRLYERRSEKTLATFMTCAILVLLFGTFFSVTIYSCFMTSPLQKFCGVLLFLVVTMIWVCMVFLSAIKDYNNIFYAFFVGALVSVICALYLGKPMREEGFLLGYLIGQALTFFWLLAKLLLEFPATALWDHDFVSVFKKYWDLVLIGFFFNFAIWADKIVFWLAPDSRMIIPYFRTHDLYEAPIFFSYLTIVPTLSLFLLKIETSFYEHYRQYYSKILGKKSMARILEEKNLMITALQENMREVLIIQGVVTALCLIFTPELAKMVKLAPIQIPLFRIALIGAFLQVLLSINIILLLYFDLRGSVLAVAMTFFASNAGLSFITTRLGLQFYGYGYTYACLVSLLLAFYLFHIRMRDLEFITFAGQPVH